MCKLSEAVVLHPRTKGSFTSIAQEDSTDPQTEHLPHREVEGQRIAGNCWSNQHQGKWKTMWIIEMLRRHMRYQNLIPKGFCFHEGSW